MQIQTSLFTSSALNTKATTSTSGNLQINNRATVPRNSINVYGQQGRQVYIPQRTDASMNTQEQPIASMFGQALGFAQPPQPPSIRVNKPWNAKVDSSVVKNVSSSLNNGPFIQIQNTAAGLRNMQPRRSMVVMKAANDDPKIETIDGTFNIEQNENHLDMMFYSRKYESYENIKDQKYFGNLYKDELMANAKILATPGKGILASDESTGTIGKRFEQIDVENTHENRIAYRELMFKAPGIDEHISGAILYDETARDVASCGKPLVKVLTDRGILGGIKVDTGMVLMEGTNAESVTQGLDGLAIRAKEYYIMGLRFAKWRAVIKIGNGCPSEVAIKETATSLARYGSICQHAGIVPIIEPEIITDGDHDIKKCAEVSERVYNAVMSEMIKQRLLLEGIILKPNMVTKGADCKDQTSPEEVAFYTVRTLSRTITPAVPGITFLSGGQAEEVASQNLNAINKLAFPKHPWNMSFSFGRALQTTVLQKWKGKPENVPAAQEALLERCKANGDAALGKYEGGKGSTQSDYVANYTY